jgi:hypothetical protein
MIWVRALAKRCEICRPVQQVISTACVSFTSGQNRASQHQTGKQPCSDEKSSIAMAVVCRNDHRSDL